jgi:hypothetical protein
VKTRWLIVVTAKPAVVVEHEGDPLTAQRCAQETAQAQNCQCVLLGQNHDLWHMFGNYRPSGRAPQQLANGSKQS